MAGSEGLWIYGQHRGQRLDSLRQRETVREPRGNKGEKGLGGRGGSRGEEERVGRRGEHQSGEREWEKEKMDIVLY